MERLTNKREADQQRRNYEKRLEQGYPRNVPEERFLRLAAYEDTGLEPEKIEMLKDACDQLNSLNDSLYDANRAIGKDLAKWKKAESEGRLVVLPCKVGGTVWKISRAYKTTSMYTIAGFLHDGIRWKMRLVKTISSWVGNKTEHAYVSFASFGKTVFLTREEAVAALAKDKNVPSKQVNDLYDEDVGDIPLI